MFDFRTFSGKEFGKYAAQINNLREYVWRSEGAKIKNEGSEASMLDDEDFLPNTMHFAYFLDQVPVAASRIVLLHDPQAVVLREDIALDIVLQFKGPYATFSRLVVHPDYRSQGLADKLSIVRIFQGIAMGAQTFATSSVGIKRAEYWYSLGFKKVAFADTTVAKNYIIDRELIGCAATLEDILPNVDLNSQNINV